MYTEFIIIYATLAAVLVLLITLLVLQIKLLHRTDSAPRATGHTYPTPPSAPPASAPRMETATSAQRPVAFCKACAAELTPEQRFCPKCGTRR